MSDMMDAGHTMLARADALNGVECMPRPRSVPTGPGSVTVVGDDVDAQRARDKLDVLRRAVEDAFPGCEGLAGATRCVFGEGDATAQLVFVGEAPGAEEDRCGRPFVGRAGQKLDEIIAAIGLNRSEVYICNVLKARPPGNRAPLPDEVDMSVPWLWAQLRIIRPRVIVALGGPATKVLLDTTTGITRLRGQWGVWNDPDGGLSIDVMPTFHPAYLLRNYTQEVRGQMWSDVQQARQRMQA